MYYYAYKSKSDYEKMFKSELPWEAFCKKIFEEAGRSRNARTEAGYFLNSFYSFSSYQDALSAVEMMYQTVNLGINEKDLPIR